MRSDRRPTAGGPARPALAGGPDAVVLGGSSNSLAVARSLSRQGVRVHGLSDGAGGSLLRYSRHVAGFVEATSASRAPQVWDDWLDRAPDGAVLLPCSDIALEYLATRRPALTARGLRPPESDDDVTLAMLDKQQTYQLARAVGVRAPRTATLEAGADLDRVAADFTFPCAVKPRHSHRFAQVFGVKAVVVRDVDELRRTLTAIDEAGLSVLLTEIVPGRDDAYCSYYTYLTPDGEALLHFTKRKPRQNPPGFGLGTLHESDWVPEAAREGLRFFRGVGLTWIGNVEFKVDARDGGLTLIECNPRFTAADRLVQNAGVDLAGVAYRRAVGLDVPPVADFATGVRQWHPWEDAQAFWAYRSAGQLSTGDWVRSLARRQHLPVFDRDDPAPTLVHDARFLLGKGRGAARRARRAVTAAGRPRA
ncbi:hypothetical protein ACFP6A_04280 [Quadrisphaera sp. GCM10027208]|uniref:carboxylate--amine ligase n=1 Tax=Quadrisphaera sp. GCM10027208 TaxID=3273423 RepID=UPI00360789F3